MYPLQISTSSVRTISPAILTVALLLALISCPAATAAEAESGPVKIDPNKVLGYETCQKCHGQEIDVWKQTPHYETYRSLHRKPEAQQIAERMGIRSIKRGDLCLKCHYTQQSDGGRVKAISGISCESCHGAAQDWLALHNDYGGAATRETEDPTHAKERRSASIAAGMQNPSNLYLIARSCYNCHTVPNEKLVNVGGHNAGSEGFELVAWSQGMIRHNFVRTGYTSNATSAPDRLRVMYVVGQLTNLEYSLRATATASAKERYGVANATRAFHVRRHLAELQEKLNHPLLTRALDAAYGIKLKSNNPDALALAADQVGAAANEFADTVQGSALGAVDAYLPSADQYRQ